MGTQAKATAQSQRTPRRLLQPVQLLLLPICASTNGTGQIRIIRNTNSNLSGIPSNANVLLATGIRLLPELRTSNNDVWKLVGIPYILDMLLKTILQSC